MDAIKGWKVRPLTTGEDGRTDWRCRDGRILHFNGTSSALCRNLLEVGSRPGAVGHLHGGIARLPLLGGVISPQFRLFPRYSRDCYEKDGKYIVVSKGLRNPHDQFPLLESGRVSRT